VKRKQVTTNEPSVTIINTATMINTVPLMNRCQYKTGSCPNERARKPNATFHSLCEKHRLVHNFNQRNFDRKKRAVKKVLLQHQNEILDAIKVEAGAEAFMPILRQDNTSSWRVWSEEDLSILRALLC
jgi:hypothetical protein